MDTIIVFFVVVPSLKRCTLYNLVPDILLYVAVFILYRYPNCSTILF